MIIKTIKRVVLSCLSVLGISFLIWVVLLLNPSLSYAKTTVYDNVTVYHNLDLELATEGVIHDAIEIIKSADIYEGDLKLQLCLNDDKLYKRLHPFSGGALAYAFSNKTVIDNCEVSFDKNLAEAEWAVNNFEYRKFDLTKLLAHEFMHNLQYNAYTSYFYKTTFGKINWKFEGHADYISRGYKNDNRLKEKIEFYLLEETKEHPGMPVYDLEDGTKWSFTYLKYALVVQYLMDVKSLDFYQVCDLPGDLNEHYNEMLTWYRK